MLTDVDFVYDAPRQFAFAANAPAVRAFVPAATAGVYMLLRDARPFYVGRSDSCVQRRLAGHALLELASHVTWEPCADPVQAFRMESAWFHELRPRQTLLNRNHPARPAGLVNECPFCGTGDCQALATALRGFGRNGAARQVAADQMAVAAKT